MGAKKLAAYEDRNISRFLIIVRVLQNFAEYVKITLILTCFAEINNASQLVSHITGGLLSMGRLIH